MEKIEIENVTYLPVPRKTPSKSMIRLIGMASLLGQPNPYRRQFGRVSTHEIIEEFRLIKKKQSKLSANNRRLIEREFRSRFQELLIKTK